MHVNVIQADQNGPSGPHKEIIQFGWRQLHLVCDFLICWRAAEPVQQLGMRALQQRNALVNRTRNPIHGSNFVQHGAPNTKLRIGFELRFPTGVVFIHRVHQSHDAD